MPTPVTPRRTASSAPTWTPWLLLALALATRLAGLTDPAAAVWDERHYYGYASGYLTGTHWVNVHPPLAPLLWAGWAGLLGLSGDALAVLQPAPLLRVPTALAGALLVPLTWWLARALGAPARVATLAAALLLLDPALTVESRFVLPDALLLLAALASATSAARAWHAPDPARRRWLLGSAVAAGLAVSIKWTGLSALPLLLGASVLATGAPRRGWRARAGEGALLCLVPLALYVALQAVHLALMPRMGPEARVYPPAMQATLQGGPGRGVVAAAGPVERLLILNRTMAQVNRQWDGLRHPESSPWWSWLVARRPITFFHEGSAAAQRWIIFAGSPVVWIGALLGMLATLYAALLARVPSLTRHRPALVALTAAWLMNVLPFALIARPMFTYHYLTALVYAVVLAAWGVGSVRARWAAPALIGAAALWFAVMAPMTYGWAQSPDAARWRIALIERRAPR